MADTSPAHVHHAPLRSHSHPQGWLLLSPAARWPCPGATASAHRASVPRAPAACSPPRLGPGMAQAWPGLAWGAPQEAGSQAPRSPDVPHLAASAPRGGGVQSGVHHLRISGISSWSAKLPRPGPVLARAWVSRGKDKPVPLLPPGPQGAQGQRHHSDVQGACTADGDLPMPLSCSEAGRAGRCQLPPGALRRTRSQHLSLALRGPFSHPSPQAMGAPGGALPCVGSRLGRRQGTAPRSAGVSRKLGLVVGLTEPWPARLDALI